MLSVFLIAKFPSFILKQPDIVKYAKFIEECAKTVEAFDTTIKTS